jgi:hypothetical protein
VGLFSVAELAELDWSPPREHVDIDVEAIAASVPRTATIKRVFIDLAARKVAARMGRDEVLARAKVDASPGDPYDDVPWHDYFGVLMTVALELRGREQISHGLREIGRSFYPGMAGTLTGRMLLGKQLSEVIRQAAENWQRFNTIGTLRTEILFERNFRFHFDGYPLPLVETVAVGIFEGVFRYHHMPAQFGLAKIGPASMVIDLRW